MSRISEDDKIFIRELRKETGIGAKALIKKFPNKHWKVSTLNDLIRKIDSTGNCKRRVGSGRPKSVRTAENIHKVEDGGHFEHLIS